ncbi:TPA: hypothetical protein KRH68_000694 [Clostridioides difficile]|uniref:hypothetical protein n=1 Tax=Clostridioides difficile TaxID=1496 RepID=UPI000BD6AACA|nr:hypothetical protein [Clostridioides difficile]PBG28878.1 hypothetical protein BGU81_07105 [Clostridioides difficile]HBG8638454.1 hypothetical protein [Clostridioides difficile]HCQ6142631.1 hypothetical protein [Clostridioides difficile]
MNLQYFEKDKYYVYKHYIIEHDGSENVFYIGKGIGDRIYNQIRNEKWDNIVKSNNNNYNVDIIKYFENEKDALDYETKLQLYYWNNGQCKGCADIDAAIGKEKIKKQNELLEEGLVIQYDYLNKWLFKYELENIINTYELKDNKRRVMSANKFINYLKECNYRIEKTIRKLNGKRVTMYKICDKYN